MASINSVQLLGNLTRDPEVRYTPKGSAVADLSMAINRVWYDDQDQKHEETDFFDITVFGKAAENCGRFLAKGLRAHVQGRLKQDTWEDKATGQKRYKVKVIADTVTFIDFKEKDEPQQPVPARQATAAQQKAAEQVPRPGYSQARQPSSRPGPRRGPGNAVQYAPPQPDPGDDDIPY